MIGKGQSEVFIDIVLVNAFSIKSTTVFILLITTYIASVIALYISETMWHRSITEVVRTIVKAQPESLDRKDKKTISKGSASTIRVGGILLKTLFPILIGIASAIALVYVNPFFLFAIILIALVASFFMLGVGRKAKKISANIMDDDEAEDDKSSTGNRLDSRLLYLSEYFQLRAKSILITNIVLACMIGAAANYWFATNTELEVQDATDLIISLALLRLIYLGISSVATKSVPLSRQYPNIRDFLIVTEKNNGANIHEK